jgi:hypothetical protein
MEEYKGPFWRSNNSIFIIIKSLKEIHRLVGLLQDENKVVQSKVKKHFGKYTDNEYSDQAMIEFAEIIGNFVIYQSELEGFVNTATFMANVELESRINMFCFFNIGEVATDAIETLSLVKKMEIVHCVLGIAQFKGTKPYEALDRLVEWRNKYAHGKCTDMPKDKLRKNHLNYPDKYPSPKEMVENLLKYINHYLIITDHLSQISRHSYTSGSLSQNIEIEKLKSEIEKSDFHILDL